MAWYWLSFAEDPPGDFLGGCQVEAFDETGAVVLAHQMEINPGGQVLAVELPERLAAPAYQLLDSDWLLANGFRKLGDLDL